MKNLVKILTGIISLWIFFDLFVFIFFMGAAFFEPDFDDTFNRLYHIQIITAFFTIPLMIFYIIHIFKNNRINKDKKVLWSLAVFGCPQ
jgi:uncharacterized membrane protein